MLSQSVLILLSCALVPKALFANEASVSQVALEADGECSASSTECTLNALQRRATDVVAESEDEFDADPKEVSTAGTDGRWHPAAAAKTGGETAGETTGETENENEWRPHFLPKTAATCCKCSNGHTIWSRTGSCAYCGGHLLFSFPAGPPCGSPMAPGYPGGQACAQRCR